MIKKLHNNVSCNITLSTKKLFSSILALFPLIMIINIPIINIGLSTALTLLFLPYSLSVIKLVKTNLIIYLSCLICFGYMVFRCLDSGIIAFILYLSIIIHLFGFFSNSIDFVQIRKTIEKASVILTFLVLIQIVFYFIFGIKFTYLFEEIIVPDERYMIQRFINSENLFRPSAVFLEPAHYAQFSCVGLVSTLFPIDQNEKVDYKKASWIAFGCLLTRSGIGIVLMFAILLTYIIFSNKNNRNNIIKIIVGLLGFLVFIYILSKFSFMQEAYGRIFGEYTNGNAIWGRTVKYGEYIRPMSGSVKILGYGGGSKPSHVYMTGFMETVYDFGYLGFIILILFLLFCALKKRNLFSLIMLIFYIGLMFSSDVVGFINILFYSSFILYSPDNCKTTV